jgi:hypothetical protein
MANTKGFRSPSTHRLTRIDRIEMKGLCAICGYTDVIKSGRGNSFGCRNANLDSIYRNSKGRHGLTREEGDRFKALVGCCELCEEEDLELLVIDHCHTNNNIRGVLCRNCNTGLGYLKDNPMLLRKAAEYLEDKWQLHRKV